MNDEDEHEQLRKPIKSHFDEVFAEAGPIDFASVAPRRPRWQLPVALSTAAACVLAVVIGVEFSDSRAHPLSDELMSRASWYSDTDNLLQYQGRDHFYNLPRSDAGAINQIGPREPFGTDNLTQPTEASP